MWWNNVKNFQRVRFFHLSSFTLFFWLCHPLPVMFNMILYRCALNPQINHDAEAFVGKSIYWPVYIIKKDKEFSSRIDIYISRHKINLKLIKHTQYEIFSMSLLPLFSLWDFTLPFFSPLTLCWAENFWKSHTVEKIEEKENFGIPFNSQISQDLCVVWIKFFSPPLPSITCAFTDEIQPNIA